jgi:hypothetical protein
MEGWVSRATRLARDTAPISLHKAAKLDEPDLRAVALETGVQNYPLILALVSPPQHGRSERPLGKACELSPCAPLRVYAWRPWGVWHTPGALSRG